MKLDVGVVRLAPDPDDSFPPWTLSGELLRPGVAAAMDAAEVDATEAD